MIHNFSRVVDTETVDRLNGAIDDLASSENYLHPVPVASPLGLFVMSLGSYEQVQESLKHGANKRVLSRAFGQSLAKPSAANQPIAAVPHEIRFPGLRTGADNSIKQEVKQLDMTLNGVRRVQLEVKPIQEDAFCPPEFKLHTEELGATKFYDSPTSLTVGWTQLETESAVMQQRREQILGTILDAVPFMLLDEIQMV
jgi:hypothetical protein